MTSCFQRLEFLGDAVLGGFFYDIFLYFYCAISFCFVTSDYLVTRYYYDDPLEYSPAILTDLRSATVNNEMFAVLAVRHGFHSHLKYMSVTLTALLDQFIRIQEQNGHKTKHNVYIPLIWIFQIRSTNPDEFLLENHVTKIRIIHRMNVSVKSSKESMGWFEFEFSRLLWQ